MADKFSFTDIQRNTLRTQLATTLLLTELGGKRSLAYEFSFAQTGKSGYSFGVAQVDLGAGRNPGANVFLKSIGLSDAEIATLRSGGSGNVENSGQSKIIIMRELVICTPTGELPSGLTANRG